MKIGNVEIGNGHPTVLGLSVTDALGPEMAQIRIIEIMERTSGLDNFKVVCIRDDISDPEIFGRTVESVFNEWDGGMILESHNPASLLTASAMCEGALLSGCKPETIIEMGAVTGFPVAIRCKDISELLDMVQRCDTDCVLDPDAVNMKSCLELNTDLHRLSSRITEADHPIMTRAWSGEYAMAMASVSIMRYGALMIMDDMDRQGCMLLDSLSSSFRGHE